MRSVYVASRFCHVTATSGLETERMCATKYMYIKLLFFPATSSTTGTSSSTIVRRTTVHVVLVVELIDKIEKQAATSYMMYVLTTS